MSANRIPRNFKEITFESLVNSSETKVGDIVRVKKDDCGRYLGTNQRTGKVGQYFVLNLRNSDFFKILEIELDKAKTDIER